MGSRAIYSITENGVTMYMYGQWAASQSLPYFLLRGVEHGTYDPKEHLHLAEKMAVVPSEPEQVVEIVGDEWAEGMLQDFGSVANVSMHVEIDADTNSIRFEHNPLCYHQQPEDFSVAINAGMEEYIRNNTPRQEPEMRMDT